MALLICLDCEVFFEILHPPNPMAAPKDCQHCGRPMDLVTKLPLPEFVQREHEARLRPQASKNKALGDFVDDNTLGFFWGKCRIHIRVHQILGAVSFLFGWLVILFPPVKAKGGTTFHQFQFIGDVGTYIDLGDSWGRSDFHWTIWAIEFLAWVSFSFFHWTKVPPRMKK